MVWGRICRGITTDRHGFESGSGIIAAALEHNLFFALIELVIIVAVARIAGQLARKAGQPHGVGVWRQFLKVSYSGSGRAGSSVGAAPVASRVRG